MLNTNLTLSVRKIILIIILVSSVSKVFSQYIDLNFNKKYKYFPGFISPGANWKDTNLNDASWLEGYGSIGYGDNDDNTKLTVKTKSVYIRYELKIDTAVYRNSNGLVLYIDYDDAFIAYLNGKEIIRTNIDPLINPTNNTLALRSHEALLYRFNPDEHWVYAPVLGFFIDTATLKSCNLAETNCLAFEVHNDSISGSDLTFNFDYRFIDKTEIYSLFKANCRYISQINIDSTRLPIVKIETDEYGCNISEVTANMKVINNGAGKYNKTDDKPNEYSGNISMKIHGESSRSFPKPSYRIELQDAMGNNQNISLLGMPKENDWLLMSQFADKSLIGNEFTYLLGSKMGNYEPRTRYCELILNGTSMGIYALTETIKRDKNRLNIKEAGNDDISGGYIFRLDKNIKDGIEITYPKEEDITPGQTTYINDLYASFKSALYSGTFADKENGYKKYIDLNSLADIFFINEISKNIDGYYASFYMYKDRDEINEKIKFGPLWDYDNAFGYGVYVDGSTAGWRYTLRCRFPITRVLQDTAFTSLLFQKWSFYRKNILSTEHINSYIDSLQIIIGEDLDFNYTIWPTLDKPLKLNATQPDGILTYSDEITRLKNWIKNRVTWIDNNINNIYIPVTDIDEYITEHDNQLFRCYPNPFTHEMKVQFNDNLSGNLSIQISDISGRIMSNTKVDSVQATPEIKFDFSNFNGGVYFISIIKDSKIISVDKIIKL